MIKGNRLSAEITPESMTAILDHVKGIETQLTGVAVSLSADEKKSLTGVGPKTLDFMDKVLEYAEKNPELLPPYIDLVELKRDHELTRKLWILQKHVLPVMGRINDTMTVAGSDAYLASRMYYHHIKTLSRVNLPGTATIAKELGKLFHKPKSSSTATENENTENNPAE